MINSIEAHIIAKKDDYSQIKFELEVKKEKKFRSSYKVSPNEEILAYLLKTVPLGLIVTDGIIVTEKALYIHPKHCKGKSTNRISFENLCQYIVSQDGDKGAVFLFETPDNRLEAFGKTILDNNSGEEIARFLESIQEIFLKKNPDKANLYHQTVQNFINQCHLILQHTGLSIELHNALIDLSYKDEYCTEAVSLLTKHYARQLSTEGYQQRMEIFQKWIPEILCDKLRSMYESLVAEFGSELEDLSHDFDSNYLEEVFVSKKSDPAPSDAVLLCLGLLAVRTMQFSELDGILERIQNPEQADRIRYFRGIYANQTMQRVIDSIQNGKRSNQEFLYLTDGIGLTALHYSLILKQDDAVQKLLSLGAWKSPFIESSAELSGVYDYVNLAQFEQSKINYAVLYAVSDLMRAYMADKKALDQKISAANVLLKGQGILQDGLSRMPYSPRGNSAPENYDKAVAVLGLTMDGTQIWAEELNDQLQNLEQEIQSCAEKLFAVAQDTINGWQCSNYPLVAYLIRLYSDPEFLYSELHRPPSDFELYHYGTHYFVAPKDAGITSKDADELDGNAQDTFDPVEKPYGDSWFSPEAHLDINILRTEYHNLAKTYHPDVSSLTYSTQLFQEILQEHADIIHKLGARK